MTTHRQLILFFCLLSAFIQQGCITKREKEWQEIYQQNYKKTYPRYQSILLEKGKFNQTITLSSPFIERQDTMKPSAVFDRISNWKDSIRKGEEQAVWHLVTVVNTTGFTKWTLLIHNLNLASRVFIRRFPFEHPVEELTPERNFSSPQNFRYGDLFEFTLGKSSQIDLLIRLKSDEPVSMTTASIAPYTTSRYDPITMSGFDKLWLAGIIVITLIISIFLVLARDWIYFLFLVHFLLAYPSILLDEPGWSGIFKILFPINYVLFFLLVLFTAFKRRGRMSFTSVAAGLLLIGLYTLTAIIKLNYLLNTVINYSAIIGLVTGFYSMYIMYYWRRERMSSFAFFIAVLILAAYILMMVDGLFYNRLGVSLYLDAVIAILFVISLTHRFALHSQRKKAAYIEHKLESQKQISAAVIRSLEDERNRISQDLHDDLGGTLALAKIKLLGAVPDAGKLQEIQDIISRAALSARSIAYELMPPYFSDTDFTLLLSSYFNSLNDKQPMQFDFFYSKGNYQFTKEEELMIYRIVMELAHNCLKHSAAKSVSLRLDYKPGQLIIACTDDGIGMPPHLRSGIGFKSIESRVSFLGGDISIQAPGAGVSIHISIPYTRSRMSGV